VVDFSETFEVLVKLQDERPNQRTSKRQVKADVLRDYLWTTFREKNVVLFRDGYMSDRQGTQAPGNTGYLEYDVTIEAVDDFIDRKGEGKARVQMRILEEDN
jgi:hypothetical protein